MNKTDLIAAISDQSKISKIAVKNVIESFISIVIKTVSNGDKVSIIDFGIFSTIERESRIGINPQTREKIEIAAKIIPKFKPGSKFCEIVNSKMLNKFKNI